MKEILIIEDNALKLARMKDVLAAIPDLHFTVCQTIKATYPTLELHDWDLILLDMSFQVNPGTGKEIGKRPLAGRQILQVMRARKMDQPVIVVTQHPSFADGNTIIASIDELDLKLKKYFPTIYKTTIFIDLATDKWHEALIAAARKAFRTKPK